MLLKVYYDRLDLLYLLELLDKKMGVLIKKRAIFQQMNISGESGIPQRVLRRTPEGLSERFCEPLNGFSKGSFGQDRRIL
jgi:hypothetical protein